MAVVDAMKVDAALSTDVDVLDQSTETGRWQNEQLHQQKYN